MALGCISSFEKRAFLLEPKHRAWALRWLSLIAIIGSACQTVCAAALPATLTTLEVTSGASVVTEVPGGSVVTLTATVKAGATGITVGQVNFCDASATTCTDIHLLGTSQLTATGTAILRFRPGIGNHSYQAVFAGTNNNAGSSSPVSALSVTGTHATTTTIVSTGSGGNYGLTATVTGSGGAAPPTGTVSFIDTSYGNAVLATPALGQATAGLTWPNPTHMTTNNEIHAVALGDFNGDGITDVAVTGSPSLQQLTIFLGNSDGSYTTAPALSLSTDFLASISVADFNEDGKQDLALLDTYTKSVITLLGNGDGTFQKAAPSPTVGQFSNEVVTGDFNGDGIPDLVVLALDLTILLGNGDGTFHALPSTRLGDAPVAVVLGDFNQDGKTDLAISYTAPSLIDTLLGNGDGTFALPMPTAVFPGPGTSSIGVADFDGDGKLDLALAINSTAVGGAGDSLVILAGKGDGTFSYASSGQTNSFGSIGSIGVGDFNGDDIPDVALTDEFGSLVVFVADRSGSFKKYPTSLVSGVGLSIPIGVGDLNGDGIPDLAVGGPGNPLSLFVTEPTQTVTATANITLTGTSPHLVEASYGGDSNYKPSVSSTLSLVGAPAATTTTLSASATSVDEQQKVTLTATIQGNSPTGTVTFMNGPTSLGTATLSGNSASLTLSFASAGSLSLTATYAGDANNVASTSSPIAVTVVAPGFAVAVSPPSATVTPGQSAIFTVTITPAGGFATPVTLSCGALPSRANCAFSSPSITPGGDQPVQITLTVSTAAATADLKNNLPGSPGREPWLPAGAVVSLAGLMGFVRGRRTSLRGHQLFQGVALLTGTCAVCVALLGCGGGGGSTTPGNPGTPAGTSTISVSAIASGSSSPQNASIQLIVE
jgi:hypothetical protein